MTQYFLRVYSYNSAAVSPPLLKECLSTDCDPVACPVHDFKNTPFKYFRVAPSPTLIDGIEKVRFLRNPIKSAILTSSF